jgi:hypothetical protein
MARGGGSPRSLAVVPRLLSRAKDNNCTIEFDAFGYSVSDQARDSSLQ